jgi:hypothetical protein
VALDVERRGIYDKERIQLHVTEYRLIREAIVRAMKMPPSRRPPKMSRWTLAGAPSSRILTAGFQIK